MFKYIENAENQKYPKKNGVTSYQIETFESASVLLDKEIIVVDIDWHNNNPKLNEEQLEDLFNTFNCRTYYTKTQNGLHLYYIKPKKRLNSQYVCYLGFPIEIKKDTVCERYMGISNEVVENPIVELPDIFLDVKLANINTINMLEGDRDNTIYKIALSIKPHTSADLYMKILEFINNTLFEKPLENISKFNSLSTSDSKLEIIEIVESACQVLDIYLYQNVLYAKTGNKYTNNEIEIKRLISMNYQWLLARQINEVYNTLQIYYKVPRIEHNASLPVNFRNGSIQDGKYFPFKHTGFTTHFVDREYNPNQQPVAIVDEFLNFLSNDDPIYKHFLLQSIGYCLNTDESFIGIYRRISFIVGEGFNGKGTLIRLITKTLGADNVSHNTIIDLKDRSKILLCENKLINIGDDIQKQSIDDDAMNNLKQISSGDSTTGREIREKAREVQIKSALLFTTNSLLKSFEKDNAWKQRVRWLPISRIIKDPKQTYLRDLLTDEACDYFFKLLVDACGDLTENGFIHCPQVEEFTNQYHEFNNNIFEYVAQYEDISYNDWLCDRQIGEVYRDYKEWCYNEEYKPLSRDTFQEHIVRNLPIIKKSKRISGKGVQNVFYPKLEFFAEEYAQAENIKGLQYEDYEQHRENFIDYVMAKTGIGISNGEFNNFIKKLLDRS